MSGETQSENRSNGYEKKDLNVRMTVVWAAVTVVFLALALVGVNELFLYYKEKAFYEATLKPLSPDLIELTAREDSVLTTTELIDTAKGIWRIPIEDAMKLKAAEVEGK